MTDQLRRASIALLVPPVLVWAVLIGYVAGWQALGAVFDVLPAWLELGAMLFSPLIAFVLRIVWLRRPDVNGPYIDAVSIAAAALTLMTLVAGLRPS